MLGNEKLLPNLRDCLRAMSGDYQLLNFIKIYPLFCLPKIIVILHS